MKNLPELLLLPKPTKTVIDRFIALGLTDSLAKRIIFGDMQKLFFRGKGVLVVIGNNVGLFESKFPARSAIEHTKNGGF